MTFPYSALALGFAGLFYRYRTAARKAPTLYVSEAADGANEVR